MKFFILSIQLALTSRLFSQENQKLWDNYKPPYYSHSYLIEPLDFEGVKKILGIPDCRDSRYFSIAVGLNHLDLIPRIILQKSDESDWYARNKAMAVFWIGKSELRIPSKIFSETLIEFLKNQSEYSVEKFAEGEKKLAYKTLGGYFDNLTLEKNIQLFREILKICIEHGWLNEVDGQSIDSALNEIQNHSKKSPWNLTLEISNRLLHRIEKFEFKGLNEHLKEILVHFLKEFQKQNGLK